MSGPAGREAAEEPALGRLGTSDGRVRTGLVLGLLAAAVVLAALASLGTGAVSLPLARVASILARGREAGLSEAATARDAVIVFDIRMPRTLVGLLVGAALATAGALLQGLFRNPLADPALVGVSAGSGFAAAVVIVLGHAVVPGPVPFAALPVAAFLGALAATSLLYGIATRRGRTSIATMLLAGIAITALASAGTGFLAFLSDDRQLRDLTFWTLGSIGGSTWSKVAVVGPVIAGVLCAAPLLARALNALVLGEAEAFHLGIAVERTKRVVILLAAVAVGSAVSVAGLISFVGLVVPHVIRIGIGPDHRLLLPASALGGGILLLAADMVARVAVAPAELPIGIVTAFIGAPYFLWLLLRRNTVLDA